MAPLLDAYSFDAWELAVVEAVCRQADDVARLEARLVEDGIVATGSRGQPRLARRGAARLADQAADSSASRMAAYVGSSAAVLTSDWLRKAVSVRSVVGSCNTMLPQYPE